MTPHPVEHFDVVVVGGGQAGLATGCHLARRGLRFVILDAAERIGDSWRHRWDGLRLFTPARFDALPGRRFPAPGWSLPSKDDVAGYLETYARDLRLPVRSGVRAESLDGDPDGTFTIITTDGPIAADQVVVATGAYQAPRIPPLAAELDPRILQLHAMDYRNPNQLRPGPVLVVGASNSGAEIAVSTAATHPTILVGRDTGTMPVSPDSRLAHLFDPPFWFFINHIVRVDNPIGRAARPRIRDHGGPLERVRPADLEAAGIDRIVGRLEHVVGGRPSVGNDRTLDVTNVIWATGFRPAFEWIRLPLATVDGWPVHRRGVVEDVPGLYLVGLPFLYSGASALLGGVGRDAEYVSRAIAQRAAMRRPSVASPVAGEVTAG